MIKSTQNNLGSPLKVGYHDIDAYHNDLQYKYAEMPRIFYDRIGIKDPMTIYIVGEPNGTHSVYLGSNKIPKIAYYDIPKNRSFSFVEWLPTYIHYLIVDYHDDSILPSYPDTVKAEVVCNILQASGKYVNSDVEIFPYYVRGICKGNLELHERLNYLKTPFDKILDVFAYCNFFDMVNKVHTEEDATKYDIDLLVNNIIKVLS